MAYMACALTNIMSILIFAYLADRFDKWWIVLFSVFFLASVKSNKEKKQ